MSDLELRDQSEAVGTSGIVKRRVAAIIGALTAVIAATVLGAAPAHAADQSPIGAAGGIAILRSGTPIFQRPPVDWACGTNIGTLQECEDTNVRDLPVQTRVPREYARHGMPVELVCEARGPWRRIAWATDQPHGWVMVHMLSRHAQTRGTVRACQMWELPFKKWPSA